MQSLSWRCKGAPAFHIINYRKSGLQVIHKRCLREPKPRAQGELVKWNVFQSYWCCIYKATLESCQIISSVIQVCRRALRFLLMFQIHATFTATVPFKFLKCYCILDLHPLTHFIKTIKWVVTSWLANVKSCVDRDCATDPNQAQQTLLCIWIY